MPKTLLKVCRPGRIAYETALNLQKTAEEFIIAQRTGETLFLLEHPHTYTIGRRGAETGVLISAAKLQSIGASVFETNRGGKLTYHGIGQIVGYPVINLSPHRKDVHRYIRDLEEVLIQTLADFEIAAFRIEGLTGVHTADGKIAAIGVHLKRWVTTHGFAINVNTDLSFFDHIIACEGEPVTSMEKILGREVRLEAVENAIIRRFAEVFEMQIDSRRV